MRSLALGVVALASTLALSACAGNTPTAGAAPTDVSSPASTASPSADTTTTPTTAPTTKPAGTTSAAKPTTSKPGTSKPGASKPGKSDVSQLKALGIDLNEGVLIDVADDGQDRYMRITKNGVDFGGTKKVDATMMSLQAAAVREKNRVAIVPPFWNEDLGAGSCVAQASATTLKLETCKPGRAAQTWEVRPAGDSGQFELHGIHGAIRVDNGKIVSNGGRSGLQTIPFAG